jgi:hypothetical protein
MFSLKNDESNTTPATGMVRRTVVSRNLRNRTNLSHADSRPRTRFFTHNQQKTSTPTDKSLPRKT